MSQATWIAGKEGIEASHTLFGNRLMESPMDVITTANFLRYPFFFPNKSIFIKRVTAFR
ncbi:MAG: hypothetical protein AOA65_2279 [Candidatus Bathyarchaeota archaeon BA1]|nr:MAG: hypothetical protein AOA65_2279 [Candidatus Bathyarchaeota archaeon BA1]